MKIWMVPHTPIKGTMPINYRLESEVSTTPTHYTVVKIKNCLKTISVFKVATMKNMGGAMHPMHYRLKVKHSLHSFVNMLNLLHSNMNQYLVKNHLCNQGSHYEKYKQFPLCKGSHYMQPPNRHFSPSAKMNKTQRKTLTSPWRMHCGMPKGTPRAKATLNSEKIKLTLSYACLKESVRQSVR